MTKKSQRRLRPSEHLQDDAEYVSTWARDLVATIGKRKARAILEDYRAIADNKRLAKRDRDIAAERVQVLESLIVTT